jgi:hypothetical protein
MSSQFTTNGYNAIVKANNQPTGDNRHAKCQPVTFLATTSDRHPISNPMPEKPTIHLQ